MLYYEYYHNLFRLRLTTNMTSLLNAKRGRALLHDIEIVKNTLDGESSLSKLNTTQSLVKRILIQFDHTFLFYFGVDKFRKYIFAISLLSPL